MCIQGPGRLGWPRFRKELQPIGTHPHPANTACHLSLFFFSLSFCVLLYTFSFLTQNTSLSYTFVWPFSNTKFFSNLCIPFTTHELLFCFYDPRAWFHCVANPQKHHRTFHNGTNGRRGRDREKRELIIWTWLFKSVCLASVWPIWISPLWTQLAPIKTAQNVCRPGNEKGKKKNIKW